MPNERILIVDDEKLIRWSVRRQLEEWGYVVLEAESGTGGLAQIRAESPDLILLDVRLPDLSGIEVLREIKSNRSGHRSAALIIRSSPSHMKP